MNDQMTEKEYTSFGTEIYVSNLDQSIKFYRDALGFNVIREDPSHSFVSFEFNGAIFMAEEAVITNPRGKGVVFRFLVPNLKEYYEDVKNRGVKITKDLIKTDYGSYRFYVEDPDGYQLKFFNKDI